MDPDGLLGFFMKTIRTSRWPSGFLAIGASSLLLAGCVVTPAPEAAVVVAGPPPAAEVEVVPVAPGPEYVWVGGCWTWNGAWVWAPGHYVVRPHPRAVWVRGYWGHTPRGYAWHEGHWR